MKEEEIVIEMTPFIFEDGKTYYFQICKRDHTNNFHTLYVYQKVNVKNEKRSFWGKVTITESEKFVKVSNKGELVSVDLNTNEIKREIKMVLTANKAKNKLKNWDGFVGDIPDEVKMSLKRDSKLKDILGDEGL